MVGVGRGQGLAGWRGLWAHLVTAEEVSGAGSRHHDPPWPRAGGAAEAAGEAFRRGGAGERPLRALINGTPRAGPGRQDRRATTPHPRQPGQEPPGQGDPAAEDRRPSDALAHRGPERCGTRLQPSRAPLRSRRTWRPARHPVPGRRTPPHAAPAPATGSDDFRSRTWGDSGAWWCDRLAAVSSWSGPTGRPLGRGCTWERRAFEGRIRYFVGIPRILADRQDRVKRSHVRTGGSAHMGARQLILTETQKPRNHAEDSRSSRRAPLLPCATPSSGQANARAVGAGPDDFHNRT